MRALAELWNSVKHSHRARSRRRQEQRQRRQRSRLVFQPRLDLLEERRLMAVAPELVPIGTQSVTEGSTLVFRVQATDADPGEPLYLSIEDAPLYSEFDTNTGVFRWSPADFQAPDSFSVTIRVEDGTFQDSETFTINTLEYNLRQILEPTSGRAITLANTPGFTTELVEVDMATTDYDLPAQSFTHSLVNIPGGITHQPYLVNGKDFRWLADVADAGETYNFTVRSTDNANPARSVDAHVYVSVRGPGTGTPPIAIPDVYHALRDQPINSSDFSGGLLYNDQPFGSAAITLTPSDPAHGSFTSFNNDGSFVYQPDPGFGGIDIISYTIDNGIESNVATVEFQIYNGKPITADLGVATSQGQSVFIDALSVSSDSEPDPILFTTVLDTAHGTLTPHGNGTYTYRPAAGFVGYDSFVFKVDDNFPNYQHAHWDITGNSDRDSYGLVTIQVGPPAPYSATITEASVPNEGGVTREETLFDPCLCGCECYVGTADDVRVRYNSLAAAPDPVLLHNVELTNDSGFTDTVAASFVINGTQHPTKYFSMESLEGNTIRVADQFDLSGLATGRYDYTLTLESSLLNGGTQSFSSSLLVVNDSASPLGAGWNIAGIRRVYKDATHAGGLVTSGDGTGHWYGDAAMPNDQFGQFTTNSSGSTLIERWGKTFYFNAAGMMTSRVERTGQTSTYSYIDADSDGETDDLSQITDPFGRTVTFTYSGGLLQSVQHYSGAIATLSHTGQLLTQLTHPDPDLGGPFFAPTVEYGYAGNRLTTITQPGGGVIGLGYDAHQRLATTTFPDGSTTSFYAQANYGYGSANQLSPADVTMTSAALGIAIDTEGRQTQFQTDSYGNWTTAIGPIGDTTGYTRNPGGLMLIQTDPDPDGAGPLAAGVTEHDYDSRGNRTLTTLPDASTRSWTYYATWNVATSFTDELGQVTLYTLDAATGNVLVERLVVGLIDDALNLETNDIVTTHTYTPAPVGGNDPPRGLLASTTQPDPDGAGPFAAPVTGYAYDRYGRLVTQTNADLTTRTFTYDVANNLLTETDELGRVTSYEYDKLNRQTKLTQPDPDGAGTLTAPITTYEFDVDSNLVKLTEPGGRITLYAYNSKGQLTSQTDPDPDGAGPLAAPVTTYTYTTTGDLLTETDALGRVTTYGYTNNRLTSITQPDPDGTGPLAAPVTQLTYADDGRLLTEINPLGGVTSYGYGAMDWLVQVSLPDPDGVGPLLRPSTVYSFDTLGNVLTETDALGRVTSYLYDDLGRVLSVTQPDPDGAGPLAAPATSQTYDRLGNVLTMTDALGNVTAYAYDKLGRNTSITLPDPDGAGPLTASVTTFEFDVMSRLVRTTDPLSRQTDLDYDDAGELTSQLDVRGTTTFDHDALGRVIEITEPDPDGIGPLAAPVTQNVYDNRGFLVSVITLLGTTDYTLDNLGRQLSVTVPDPDGAGPQTRPVSSVTYNALGQVVTETDPLGRVTTYQHDALGRVTKIIQPDPDGAGSQTSPEIRYAYNAAGQLVSETNPLGKITAYALDGLGRQTSILDPESGLTTFTFDAVGNQLTLTDPVGNTTTWAYDGLNRVTSETNELSATRTFQYDAIGNLTQRTDRNARVTEYLHDNLYRPIEERWLDGQTLIRTIASEYNAAGKLLSISDPDSTYTYSYDTYGRVSVIDNNGTPGVPRVQLAQGYDEYSRRTLLTSTIATTADFQNLYQYDNLSQLIEIRQQGQSGGHAVAEKRINLGYNAAGQFTWLRRYADLAGTLLVAQSDHGYDQLGRLTSLTHYKGGTVLADYGWTFDAFSRVTTFSSATDGNSSYSYDTTSQLVSADHTYQADEAYSFDANGNRTMSGYSTGDNNQLTSDGTFNYTYDSEGNRLTRTRISSASATDHRTEYTWDHRNRLTQVTFKNNAGTVTKSVQYTYDPLNRRIAKDVDDNGDGVIERGERYAYDGEHISHVFDHTGALIHRYLHNPDSTDQVFSDEQFDPTTAGEMPTAPGDVIWPLPDNLGTNRDLAEFDDATGITAIANHRVFDSFGRLVSETDPTVQHLFGYTSREIDADSGLLYYRHRWYDAAVGRFISEDPIGFRGQDTNLSRYVGNHPSISTDPSGLLDLWWWWYYNQGGRDLNLNNYESLLQRIRTHTETRSAMDGILQEALNEALARGQASGPSKQGSYVTTHVAKPAYAGGEISTGVEGIIEVIGGRATGRNEPLIEQTSLYALGDATIDATASVKWSTGPLTRKWVGRETHRIDIRTSCLANRYVIGFEVTATVTGTFRLIDDFEDVPDIFEWFEGKQEVPGGRAYKIYGDLGSRTRSASLFVVLNEFSVPDNSSSWIDCRR